MTYSNRPASSTWQHDNLYGVSNDTVLFDKLNPFTSGNMPGAWSAPYSYAKPQVPDKEVNELKPKPHSDSPACEYASTAGDNTVQWCNPAKPNCPMSRPWLPERLFDPGMWAYNKTDKGSIAGLSTVNPIYLVIMVGVLTVAFLAMRRST